MSETVGPDSEIFSIEQASELVGDDITYWLENPFMSPDLIAEKVRWWITKAVAAVSARADGPVVPGDSDDETGDHPEPECQHDWTSRPESDTWVCDDCGVER